MAVSHARLAARINRGSAGGQIRLSRQGRRTEGGGRSRPPTALDDMIADLQMLVNLTDDESDFDGSDPDYNDAGWLRIDPMDPAGPPLPKTVDD